MSVNNMRYFRTSQILFKDKDFYKQLEIANTAT